MILSFLEGFLLGLGAAVPIGPVNILIMNEAIKNYKDAVTIGIGAMSADITYLLLIVFGLIAYINQTEILNALSLFGGFFLIYIAYFIFKNRDKKVDTPVEKVVNLSTYKLFTKGYVLTFMNPYTVAFWLSVSSYVATKELNVFITLLGMFSAILLWITIMPYIIHKSKHRVSAGSSRWISIVSSIIFFVFGIIMFAKLII